MSTDEGGESLVGSGPIEGKGFLSRAFRRLRRRLPDARPLQIDEVVAAVVETVRVEALTGLSSRYLPSAVEVTLGGEDHRYLAPFRNELTEEIQRGMGTLQARNDGERWVPTVETVEIRLNERPGLDPGSPPAVALRYPEGVRRASWTPDPSLEREGPNRDADGLSIVLTASDGEGTALQETVDVWLARALPAALVGAEPADGELWVRDGRVTVGGRGTWSPEGRVVGAEPPPEVPRGTERLPMTWDGPWVAFQRPDRRTLTWCPGGVVVIGREPRLAHLVPAGPAPAVSGAHLAVWRTGEGVAVVDLASTNGTWVDGHRLRPGTVERFPLPVTLALGSQGAVLVGISGMGSVAERSGMM